MGTKLLPALLVLVLGCGGSVSPELPPEEVPSPEVTPPPADEPGSVRASDYCETIGEVRCANLEQYWFCRAPDHRWQKLGCYGSTSPICEGWRCVGADAGAD